MSAHGTPTSPTQHPWMSTKPQHRPLFTHGFPPHLPHTPSPSGFEGPLCERNVDDCSPDPCHHGTCLDGIASFSCACAPGFTGYRCELQLDECHSSPCRNGGKCIDRIDAYQCNCPPGTAGRVRGVGWGSYLGRGWVLGIALGLLWAWGG